MKKNQFVKLKTPFENDGESWDIYPRPQMARDSYLSLCGEWELFRRKEKDQKDAFVGKIKVPFPPESRLSGIEQTIEARESFTYKKTFSVSSDFLNEKTLLHFGAVDQVASVTFNGVLLGEHTGGYLPFSFDVTPCIRVGENTLVVRVWDPLDTEIPYGKQRKKRGGMWYTPISGIWQNVWLESVPQNAFSALRLTPSLQDITLEVEGGENEKTLVIETPSGALKHTFVGGKTTVRIENPQLWSPESPHLYHFTLTDGKDTVRSYFALRTIGVTNVNGKKYLALNGKPYFFHGLLDQGYFSDGIYLPASPEGFRYDIRTMKSLGFNTLRKHIKIESDIFYYECDKQGMIVFQDMVNSGKYSFLLDTALPTVGMKKGISHRATHRRKQLFERSCEETLRLLYNHPCVCYYTIFNEGWGQYDADRLYEACKGIDPSRIFDSTSGWFEEKKSDVKSEHVYFKKLDLKESERPLVLSEFGGYSLKITDHSFNLGNTYGYRFFHDEEAFTSALEALYTEEIVPMIERGLCASILTQVSDVEDETNGLLTYDRQVLKIDAERMRKISTAVFTAFVKKTTG
ncbi:MAG: glycoside hydrolase family 2 [Clostridia bacterium]|nr:glycoside hydrolase family 2 [Clostridia bacterium]